MGKMRRISVAFGHAVESSAQGPPAERSSTGSAQPSEAALETVGFSERSLAEAAAQSLVPFFLSRAV